MTKSNPNIHIPSNYAPQMTLIVPGQRSLGEDYIKVEIGVRDDKIVAHKEKAEAPPSGRPLIALHGRDAVYAEYVMLAYTEKQRERAEKIRTDPITQMEVAQRATELYNQANREWFDHVEQKQRWLAGRTQVGPSGLHQRQRVNQNPATRPLHH